MPISLLLLGGVGCELIAIAAIFFEMPLYERLAIFALSHIAASLAFALMLSSALPIRFASRRRDSAALFFCLSCFIPFFGAIGMLLSLIYFRYFMKSGERTEFFSVMVPGFMEDNGYSAPVMGEGGAWSRLRNDQVSRELRLKALLSVGSLSGGNSSRLLQLATSDTDDEIRLLAFALFDQREHLISNAISDALASLKSCEERSQRGEICRNLAFSYWEIAYNELARDELCSFFLDRSLHYARQATDLVGPDPALTALTGRIHLAQGDVAQAEAAANAALSQGVHSDRILPYLAELAFLRRDFSLLKEIFAKDPSLRHKPGIGHVVRFWQDA